MGRTDIYGYDLDGVLCPDINVEGLSFEELMVVVKARYKLKPLFVPNHDHFYIVTGRPHSDYIDTQAWTEKYFGLKCSLVHNTLDEVLNTEQSARFKADNIELFQITVFVESCEKIAERLAQLLPNKTIITFSELCILG